MTTSHKIAAVIEWGVAAVVALGLWAGIWFGVILPILGWLGT